MERQAALQNVQQDKATIQSSTGSEGQGHRVYSADGKSKTLCGNGGGAGAKTGLYTVVLLALYHNLAVPDFVDGPVQRPAILIILAGGCQAVC